MAGNVTIKGRIQFPRFAEADLAAVNPVLLDGEVVYESSTGRRKIGDGVKTWNDLPYELAGSVSPAESLTIALGTPNSTTFSRVSDAALHLTKTDSSLIVEFFVTGNGPSPSRAVWNSKLTSEAVSYLNAAYNYGYNAGIFLYSIGMAGINPKTLSVSIVKISASSNTIELYQEGLNSSPSYSLPFNFRTVCSLK